MCLRPRTTSGLSDAQSVDTRRSSREGLNIAEASILRRALTGELSDKLPESARVPLGHLINLGAGWGGGHLLWPVIRWVFSARMTR